MTTTDYDSIIQQKIELLNKLKEAYDNDPTSEKATMVLNTLDLLTKNSDFNTQETILLVDKILDESLKLDDPSTTLTDEQIQAASQVLDNVLMYMSDHCDEGYDLFMKMQTSAPDYLETISRSTLSSSLPTDDSTIITQQSFDLYTKKV